MILYLAIVSVMPVCKSFFTSVVSAPARRRYAADSNVRSPVRMVKLLVSKTMPDSSASASHFKSSPWSISSSSSSTKSSQVEEAEGSVKPSAAF